MPSKHILRDIRRIHLQTRRFVETHLLGAYRSAFKGRGLEFLEARPFSQGDELRHIDWNVTARMQEPFVKSYREERALTVVLVADISDSLRFGSGDKSKRALMAEVSALLAISAIENHDKIGLLLFSGDVEKYLPPARGPRHALRIIRELMAAKARQPGTDLSQALTFLGRVQKKHALCFILSDFLGDYDKPALKLAAKRYECTAVRIFDPRELDFPRLKFLQIRDLETGEQRLVNSSGRSFQRDFQKKTRELLAEQDRCFQKLNIGVLDLNASVPYAHALLQYFQRRKHARPA